MALLMKVSKRAISQQIPLCPFGLKKHSYEEKNCGQRTIIFILAAVGVTLPLFSVWYFKTALRSDCDGTFDSTDATNSMGISTVAKSL